jgi:hypothetical protein
MAEILGFTTRNHGIMVANNKYHPYDRTGNATSYLYTANYTPTTKPKFSVHI